MCSVMALTLYTVYTLCDYNCRQSVNLCFVLFTQQFTDMNMAVYIHVPVISFTFHNYKHKQYL